jgi:galactoside 2-L-fucosyltransferase 1/2
LDTAFGWFTAKYGNKLSPIFVVMCGGGFHGNAPDMTVCMDMVDSKKYTAVFSKNATAVEDFAALTACNDTVVTSGTFGWWAGFLAGGDVVAYHQQIHGPLASEYDEDDYFPSTWTLLETA